MAKRFPVMNRGLCCVKVCSSQKGFRSEGDRGREMVMVFQVRHLIGWRVLAFRQNCLEICKATHILAAAKV